MMPRRKTRPGGQAQMATVVLDNTALQPCNRNLTNSQ